MKTSPCNEDPLTSHFYKVKPGFTGVYIFSYFAPKHRFWVLVLTCTHNLCFEQKQDKYHNFSPENYHFYIGEILQNIRKACLRNVKLDKNMLGVITPMVHAYRYTFTGLLEILKGLCIIYNN